MKEKHLYSFGEFSLNVEDHTLSRGGENIPITPKMFDLLLVLLQHPGRVLRKDFLLQAVWPDSFVEEGNITFNIRQLRKALNDDAQAPTYIETITRRGYRFLMPVESFTTITPDKDEESIAKAEFSPPPDTGPSEKPRPHVFLAMSAFVVLAAVLAIGGWLFRNGNSRSAPILNKPFSSEKLSTDGGVFHIAISPDGKNVVYTHRSNGKQGIWLRQLETSTNVPLVPPAEDFYGGLVMAPDGDTVYFNRGTQAEPFLTVYRMSIFGGVPQKVLEGTQGWMSLSPDGSKISYVRCPYTDDDYCSLYVADAFNGANEKKLVTRPRPFRIGDNKISPDGKKVAFAEGQSRTSSNEFNLMVVDIGTGVESALTPEKFFNIAYLTWLPDQSGLLATAKQLPEPMNRIWYVSAADGETTKLTSDTQSYSRLDLDSTGSVLVSTTVEPDFRLMLFQTDAPTVAPRVLGNANTVAFAPDGRIYFSSDRTGNSEIWSVDQDGTDLHQLTNDPSQDVVPLVSADSKTIFFQSDRSGQLHLWRMNPDGTNQTQLTHAEGGVPLRISPDARWLYYRSALNNTLRRVGLDTAEEELVLNAMGRNLVLSPDIKLGAYTKRVGRETLLTVFTIPDAQVVKTWKIGGAPNLAHLAWSDDGRYFAYILANDPAELGALWFQPLDTDVPKKIADLSGDEIAELSAFALSPDEKTFAVIKGSWKHDAVLLRGMK
ncbi:MAG TPA: winged helix-turn-helix domain-containing protein [Pyrinomonadaceae bacterium]|nr:winged helix-turn-helix domain-containing protein [Pyrinomonadaceae bacterium]